MLSACRTEGDGVATSTFEVLPSDVEGFMDELRTFQSAFHDCFSRSEPREHFFDYMVASMASIAGSATFGQPTQLPHAFTESKTK